MGKAPSASVGLDFDAFITALREITPFLEVASVPILESTGEQIVLVAKSLAPVDTAALQRDIKVQGSGIDKKGPFVDVGTTEPYALYQEFGTEHNPPRPFMRPAIAQVTSGSTDFSKSVGLAPRKPKSKK